MNQRFYPGQRVIRTVPCHLSEVQFDFPNGKPKQGGEYTVLEYNPHFDGIKLAEVKIIIKHNGEVGHFWCGAFKLAPTQPDPLKPEPVIPYPLP